MDVLESQAAGKLDAGWRGGVESNSKGWKLKRKGVQNRAELSEFLLRAT